MRHGNSGKALSRNSSHRKAMFKNMMVSLLLHETIFTTLVKAKELRRFAERLITLGKVNPVHRRRLPYARLRDKDIVQKLFTDIGPFFNERSGGYLRILKSGFRKGDNAMMAMVQLVGRQDEEEAA